MLYDTRTKPNFVLAVEPDEPPPPPEDNPDVNTTPTTIGPSPLRRPCACGAEATLFPLDAPDCYDCAFVTTPRTRLSYRAVYAKYSVTLQSLAIEAKLTVCGRCQGIHHVQKCPDLLALLLAGAA